MKKRSPKSPRSSPTDPRPAACPAPTTATATQRGPDSAMPQQQAAIGVDPTIQVLLKRNAPILEACADWGGWSSLKRIIMLRRADTAREMVESLRSLLLALTRVEKLEVLDTIHHRDPFLPATKELIQHFHDGGTVEDGERILAGWQAHPAAKEIGQELGWRIWNLIEAELRVDDQLSRAAYRAQNAVAAVDEGRTLQATSHSANDPTTPEPDSTINGSVPEAATPVSVIASAGGSVPEPDAGGAQELPDPPDLDTTERKILHALRGRPSGRPLILRELLEVTEVSEQTTVHRAITRLRDLGYPIKNRGGGRGYWLDGGRATVRPVRGNHRETSAKTPRKQR